MDYLRQFNRSVEMLGVAIALKRQISLSTNLCG